MDKTRSNFKIRSNNDRLSAPHSQRSVNNMSRLLSSTSKRMQLTGKLDHIGLPSQEKKSFLRKYDLFEKRAWKSSESFYKRNDQVTYNKPDSSWLERKMTETTRCATALEEMSLRNQRPPVREYTPTQVTTKVGYAFKREMYANFQMKHLTNEIEDRKKKCRYLCDVVDNDPTQRDCMHKIDLFRENMNKGFKDLGEEFRQLQWEAESWNICQESTKLKMHNLTERIKRLEDHAGYKSQKKINVIDSQPLKNQELEEIGVDCYVDSL